MPSGRRLHMVVLTLVVAVVTAGCIAFNVQKQVTNGTSTGPFTVHVTCTNDEGTDTDDLTFDAIDGSGQQTILSDHFDLSTTGETTCTITEPDQAGATSTTIVCVSPPAEVTCTPGATPDELIVVGPVDDLSPDFHVDILVTNDFTEVTTTTVPDPPPDVAPSAVEAAPNFTG